MSRSFALLEQTTDEQLHKMLDTNLWGTIIICREAVKHFGSAGGSIINIGSMSSERFSAGAGAAHIARTPLGRVGTPADIAAVGRVSCV